MPTPRDLGLPKGWAWTAAPVMESVNSEDSSVDSRSIVVEAPVAPFVQQLFKMVNTGTLIQWSEDGEAIEVPDPGRFAAEICPL